MKKLTKGIKVLFGIFLIAFSFNLFFIKNDIVIGDIVGLSVLANKIYNVDFFIFIFSLNVVMLALCYILQNEITAKKAIPVTLLLPIFIKLTEPLINMISLNELEILVQVIIGAILIGYGYGLIKQQEYSPGGLEVLGDIYGKFFNRNSKVINFIFNILIVLISLLYFNLENVIYAVIALVIINQISNKLMLNIGENKTFYIYTDKFKEVKNYLINEEKQDVTIFDVKGINNKKQRAIMCVLNKNDYLKVKLAIEEIDSESFLIVTDSHESINQSLSIRELTNNEN